MNLTYLQTFSVVADEQSFTKAAEVLAVSKGLVSRHVQKLEDELHAKLFHRTTRSVTLTDVGEELYEKTRHIQMLANEAERCVKDLTQEVSGDLKITAPFEFGRALCRHVIPAFIQQYPAVNLHLDFGPNKKKIEAGEFDIAFRAYDDLPNDVVAKGLGYIRNVLVCSPVYADQHRMIDIADIHQCAFIINSQNDRWNQLVLVREQQCYQAKIIGSLRCDTYSAIAELALQGVGMASLPYYQVEDLIRRGQLVHAFPEWSVKTHNLNLIYAQRRIMPKKLLTFNLAVKRWLEASHLYTFAPTSITPQ